MIRKAEMLAMAVLLVAVHCTLGYGQVAPPTILVVDVENYVQYQEDTSDLSKFATDPNRTTPTPAKTFGLAFIIGDIVAVNGQPAKGTVTHNTRNVALTPAPNPGQVIADTVRQALVASTFEILSSDGTPIGTIVSYGLLGGSPPPGAPLSVSGNNYAITGGTGAFLGARGQWGECAGCATIARRQASITEDPANRRLYGGGRLKYVLQVIPIFRPQVAITSSGPAVFHADFSPVTAAKPAKAGEVLIAQATGLGPTVPGVNPGQPFPTDAILQVNSPVAVTVNGQAAELVNSIGWPALVDTYRVDFRMPDGATAGTATIQLTAAWILGPSVNVPVQ